jgi:hypothetical protein
VELTLSMRRFGVGVVLGATVALTACGGHAASGGPSPQTMQETVTGFLHAVQTNDLGRMGRLWGNDRGPAATWMKPEELAQRLTVIQKYLAHTGSRVVEGPLTVPGKDNLRAYRVELQRPNCTRVVPLDIVQTHSGAWVVFDVHLEAAGNPVLGCSPAGTRP